MQHLKSRFLLRSDITYLNFGSFGACARPVFEKYQQFQLELEQEPVLFITGNGPKYLEQSRAALGQYLHADKDDLVYVSNPSYAVNAVARSMKLKAGDEVLTTDLEYGACDKTWAYYCEQTGARYIRQAIPLPLTDKTAFADALFKGVSKQTKLIFISHITSSTALRLPVEEVIARAKTYGIPVFVDGAHAPGQIPLDLAALGADYYTGACHKWMLTPKGSSFLFVQKEKQGAIDPLVISWGYKAQAPSHSSFLDYHQFNGTRDFSAFLTIPAAIEFMKENDWEKVSASCRQLVKDNAAAFFEVTGGRALAPLTDQFILQLLSAEIKTSEPEKLHELLFEKYKIQIPVMRHGDKVYLRYSINAFNSQEDMNSLFAAIKDIKATTGLLA
jgi:isopenicillin-N epimerase